MTKLNHLHFIQFDRPINAACSRWKFNSILMGPTADRRHDKGTGTGINCVAELSNNILKRYTTLICYLEKKVPWRILDIKATIVSRGLKRIGIVSHRLLINDGDELPEIQRLDTRNRQQYFENSQLRTYIKLLLNFYIYRGLCNFTSYSICNK